MEKKAGRRYVYVKTGAGTHLAGIVGEPKPSDSNAAQKPTGNPASKPATKPADRQIELPLGDIRQEQVAATLLKAAKLHRAGKRKEAEQLYRAVLGADPFNGDALHLLGLILNDRGQRDEAVQSIEKAIKLHERNPNFHNSLGVVLLGMKRGMEARRCFERVLQLEPNSIDAHYNLGVEAHERGAIDDAARHYQDTLGRNPDHAGALNNLAAIELDRENLRVAETLSRRVVALQPRSTTAWKNLGRALRHQGLIADADAAFKKALEIAPDDVEAAFGRAMTTLLSGNLLDGFIQYQARYRMKDNPPRYQDRPMWRGEAMPGRTLLIHTEQGLGDAIQFARYIPIAAVSKARVVVECHSPLARLFARIQGVSDVVARGNPVPQFDVQVPLMELPRIFRTKLNTIPSNLPYLSVDDAWHRENRPLVNAPAQTLKIGLCLGTGSRMPGASRKALPLDHVREILRSGAAHFVNLQKDAAAETTALFELHGADDPSPGFVDMATTAAMIAKLDLVISIDTSVAHLAGALNKPTWLLLTFAKDWRWLLDRPDSPWYPSMRLFRQPTPGDWGSVAAQVIEALRA